MSQPQRNRLEWLDPEHAPEDTMLSAFQFLHDGRTYTCRVEESNATARTPAEKWWWVEVSDDRARYALFRAARDDSETSVRSRVVSYYESLLARRAAPPEGWWSRNKGTKAAPAKSKAAQERDQA